MANARVAHGQPATRELLEGLLADSSKHHRWLDHAMAAETLARWHAQRRQLDLAEEHLLYALPRLAQAGRELAYVRGGSTLVQVREARMRQGRRHHRRAAGSTRAAGTDAP